MATGLVVQFHRLVSAGWLARADCGLSRSRPRRERYSVLVSRDAGVTCQSRRARERERWSDGGLAAGKVPAGREMYVNTANCFRSSGRSVQCIDSSSLSVESTELA